MHVWWLTPAHSSADQEVWGAGCVGRGRNWCLGTRGAGHTPERLQGASQPAGPDCPFAPVQLWFIASQQRSALPYCQQQGFLQAKYRCFTVPLTSSSSAPVFGMSQCCILWISPLRHGEAGSRGTWLSLHEIPVQLCRSIYAVTSFKKICIPPGKSDPKSLKAMIIGVHVLQRVRKSRR